MREIVLDTETTGLDPLSGHKVVEIGCVELVNRVRTGNFFHVYINPERDMPKEAFAVHGLSTEFLQEKKKFADIYKEFLAFLGDSQLVIHNARFDLNFLNHELMLQGQKDLSDFSVIDTLIMARKAFPGAQASLDALCKRFKIDLSKRERHGALLDAELLAEVYINLTGGRQSKIEFTEQKRPKSVNSLSGVPRQFREPREANISAEEERNHDEFMKKIRDPLWS